MTEKRIVAAIQLRLQHQIEDLTSNMANLMLGLTINSRIQWERSWVKDQLHVLGLTNSIMLSWVTNLMNQYAIIPIQSGFFGSRPWAKLRNDLTIRNASSLRALEWADKQSLLVD